MPALLQLRNAAYLNRGISRFGPQDRELGNLAPRARPDLRLISGARSNDVADPPELAGVCLRRLRCSGAAQTKGET